MYEESVKWGHFVCEQKWRFWHINNCENLLKGRLKRVLYTCRSTHFAKIDNGNLLKHIYIWEWGETALGCGLMCSYIYYTLYTHHSLPSTLHS